MQVTGTFLVFVPLAVLALFGRPIHLLFALFISTIFTTGAPVNIGGSGVKLFFMIAGCFLLRLAALSARQRLAVPPGYWRIAIPFIAFAAFGAATAFINPRLYAGQVFVLPPRGGIWMDAAELLAPSMTNINQALYLLFNTLLQLALPLYLYNFLKAADLRPVTIVTLLGTASFIFLQYLPGGLDILQFLAWTDISSKGGVVSLDDGTVRLVGPFTEASVLSSWITASFAMLLCLMISERNRALLLPVGLAGLILLFSTSSTGFLGLAISFFFLLLVALPYCDISVGRLIRGFGPLLLLAAPVVLLGFASLMQVIEAQILNKGSSGSFAARVYSDLIGLGAFLGTNYMGAGLGSHRGSSGIVTILACTGAAGFGLFVWSYGRLFRSFMGTRRAVGRLRQAGDMRPEMTLAPAAFTGLLGLLAIFALTVGDLANPILPFLTGICIWQCFLVSQAGGATVAPVRVAPSSGVPAPA